VRFHFNRELSICGLACSLILAGAPNSSYGQYDLIAVFSDTTHTNCSIGCLGEDCNSILFYFFHYSTVGAHGSRFMSPYHYCLGEHGWSGDFKPFPNTIGNTQEGITITYGGCRTGWTHILTSWYYACCLPGTAPCCEQAVLPHPNAAAGQVEVLDCTDTWVPAAEISSAFVNFWGTCACSTPTGIPNQTTTWGFIKGLYSDEP
jgi:hypothetical protein